MSGMIEVGVIDKLKAATGVTALTGVGRIFMRLADQSPTLPYLVVTKPGSQESVHCAIGPAGLAMGPVMVRCYGSSQAASRDLARQVKLALDGQRGAFGSVAVRMCLLEDELDVSSLPQSDDEVGYPGFALTFNCAWVNPVN
jgi:hypothetical protein